MYLLLILSFLSFLSIALGLALILLPEVDLFTREMDKRFTH